MVQVVNIDKDLVLAHDARLADSFFSRLIGLLRTDRLPPGNGLVIRPCNSVHTFGMRYAIDVIFTDNQGRILKIIHRLNPGELALCRGAVYGVELPAGTAYAGRAEIGDTLQYRSAV